jgi:pimeloyl-ACP methyl ester carboxylesterase
MQCRFLTIVLLPLLLATSAVSPSGAILPDGTYRYETTIGGRPAGASTIVVSRTAGMLKVAESASLAGLTLQSSRELWENGLATIDYHVVAYGKSVAVTISGNVATLRSAGQTAAISAKDDAPFLVNDNMVAAFFQIPATLHATGAKKLTFACVCGQFSAVPVSVTGGRAGVVTILLDAQTGTLKFDPQTYALTQFDLPSQNLTIALKSYDPHPTPLASPGLATPMPLPPARYTSRDVAIRASDGVTLAGTLTIPDAASTPMPGFVFVHGSGCIDRDETIGPNKIFAQLANRLSNDGYAVLRYDKRSCGKSGGTFAPRDRLIADARDVIAYLRSQPGIDPNRIYVLGHSEGGELVPSIAIADARLRGIILLAPPALPLDQILMQQLLRNTTDADRAAEEKRVHAGLDDIESGKATGAYNAWLRSSFGIDPAKLIAQVPSPILIVQGGKDIQVLAADTPRLVEAAHSTHRRLTVVMLPDDDHLFIKLGAAQTSTGGEYFTPSYLDPALFRAIESWLRGS